MKISVLPILEDNYAYVLQGDDGAVGVVDPGTAEPVIEFLEARGLSLDTIFLTHHHWDHVNGVPALLKRYDCDVAGPRGEADKIKHLKTPLYEGGDFAFDGEKFEAFETPGHTLGAICLYFPESAALFSGDTLFSMGCGRLFEGTAQQMWESFQKILALPDETLIYPGHEYTLANGAFCQSVEPENADLQQRMDEVRRLRADEKPSIPVSLAVEKATNVFLRAGSADTFAARRALKDRS
ncbi:MAG: hydroxyacylglutathione hydrolase [Alphaproteobacteria bacterium]|nr:hydroxyacylglutathione hydrolase [Alphaproteobacteria bacterium]